MLNSRIYALYTSSRRKYLQRGSRSRRRQEAHSICTSLPTLTLTLTLLTQHTFRPLRVIHLLPLLIPLFFPLTTQRPLTPRPRRPIRVLRPSPIQPLMLLPVLRQTLLQPLKQLLQQPARLVVVREERAPRAHPAPLRHTIRALGAPAGGHVGGFFVARVAAALARFPLPLFEVGESGLGGRPAVEALVGFVLAEEAEVVGPFGVAVLFRRVGVGVGPDFADL